MEAKPCKAIIWLEGRVYSLLPTGEISGNIEHTEPTIPVYEVYGNSPEECKELLIAKIRELSR